MANRIAYSDLGQMRFFPWVHTWRTNAFLRVIDRSYPICLPPVVANTKLFSLNLEVSKVPSLLWPQGFSKPAGVGKCDGNRTSQYMHFQQDQPQSFNDSSCLPNQAPYHAHPFFKTYLHILPISHCLCSSLKHLKPLHGDRALGAPPREFFLASLLPSSF